MKNFRAHGTSAKNQFGPDGLPKFTADDEGKLSGRIHIGPEIDYLSAFDASKYGEFS